ncbi:malate dehydrogenase [Nakamurella flava]|uniref:Malate dehydrogenase n=1 Tax=Nakamurella flava TaxID=2576308 RepID=A0A4U6Q958_9ACTN|nr:malate dehydrogenase [Nakamurella flava]TKV56408.1 malate dehydrogenase [Nakamurella flava]
MTVWGADAVEDAHRAGQALVIAARDILTPLAQERARELQVAITTAVTPPTAVTPRASAPSPAAGPAPVTRASASTAPAPPAPVLVRARAAPRAWVYSPPAPFVGAPSGALYRRGAPVAGRSAVRAGGPPRPVVVGAGRTGRVVVVGAGHVGMIAALRLVDADQFAEVVLVDIDEGRAAGIALDLTHTAALSGFATAVRGVGTVEAAGPADYVVITAGKPRQPGMSRSDLISTNAAIVGDLARRCAAVSPDAVLVVVTNPLDEMTQHAWQASGFPSSRVVGMAGVLDTARFQALAALGGSFRADQVSAWALGSHGEEMVIPLSQARIDGRPLTDRIPSADVRAVVDRARGSGAEVVGLLRSGSAFMAPGMSAARMVLAMARDSGEVLPAAVLADGTYGIRDVYVGLPARLGRHGVTGIVPVDLQPDELAALRAAADRIRERLADLATAS